MSQVSRKPVTLPVRKRLKPTVNLNVACRRRKDTKDQSPPVEKTTEVEDKKIITKSERNEENKNEDKDSSPIIRKETINTPANDGANKTILNTSFESNKSISSVSTVFLQDASKNNILNESFKSNRTCKSVTSSVSTVLLNEAPKDDILNESFESNRTCKSVTSSVTTVLLNDAPKDNILNESFESNRTCKSVTSSVSTVLLHGKKDNCDVTESHEFVLDQSIESDEHNGVNTSDTIMRSNAEIISSANKKDENAFDEQLLSKTNSAKCVGSVETEKDSPSGSKANEKKGISLSPPNDSGKNGKASDILSTSDVITQGSENGDLGSINDDQSSVSEHSLQTEGSDFSLPKFKRKISSMSKRLSEAKRSFEARYFDKKPERSSLRMLDLIYYNPSTNPMKSSSEKPDEIVVSAPLGEGDMTQRAEEEEEDDVDNPSENDQEDDSANGIPAPRVKVGPNGEIILDEQSLVIETTQSKKSRQEIANLTVVVDSGSNTTYHTYSKKKRIRSDWSVKETIRFYKALQTLGTDFSLMQTLFPTRTRLDLKSKYKKEERINGHLIEKALRFPSLFDISELEKDQTNEENKESRPKKKQVVEKRPRKRSLKSLGFDEEDRGPTLKKTKRRKVKTLAQRNRVNDPEKQTKESERRASSSDEEYQLPTREQQLQEGTNKKSERRSSRIKKSKGVAPNYADVENRHDFLEAGVDLLESSDDEEDNDVAKETETSSQSVPEFNVNNVQPGSLVILTSQCPNNPGYQICNIYMVQDRSGGGGGGEDVRPSPTSNCFSVPLNAPDASTESTEQIIEPR